MENKEIQEKLDQITAEFEAQKRQREAHIEGVKQCEVKMVHLQGKYQALAELMKEEECKEQSPTQ